MYGPTMTIGRTARRTGRSRGTTNHGSHPPGPQDPRTPGPKDPTPTMHVSSPEWDNLLDDLAKGRIFPRLSADHRQEMALILLVHRRIRGDAPGAQTLHRAFRTARARLRRNASHFWRLVQFDHEDIKAPTDEHGEVLREQALAALRRIATWPAGPRSFFLTVALDGETPVRAARRHLGDSWTARHARNLWQTLRVRLARELR